MILEAQSFESIFAMFGVNRTSIDVVGGQNSRDVSAEKFSKFYVGSARFFTQTDFCQSLEMLEAGRVYQFF